MKVFRFIIMLQTILYYLGLAILFWGFITLFGENTSNGIKLVIGGIVFFIIKYVILFLFFILLDDSGEISKSINKKYDELYEE